MASTENAYTGAASGRAASAASHPAPVATNPPPPTTVNGSTGAHVDRWSLVAALITEFVRNARTQP